MVSSTVSSHTVTSTLFTVSPGSNLRLPLAATKSGPSSAGVAAQAGPPVAVPSSVA